MQELKRKMMRLLRWFTAGAQWLWLELYAWGKEYWFALLVGIIVGMWIG